MTSLSVQEEAAREVAPALARLLRAIAVVLAVGTAGVVVLVAFDASPLTHPASIVASIISACTSIAVARADLVEAFATGRGRWLVDAYPLVIATVILTIQASQGPIVIASTSCLFIALTAGITGSRSTVVAASAVMVLAEFTAAARVGGEAWATALGIAVLTVLMGLVGHVVAGTHRSAVREQIAAHRRTKLQSTGLAAVASASSRIHVLESDALAEALTSAAAVLGWEQSALLVRPIDGGAMAPVGAHGVDPTTVDAHRPDGMLAEVLRTEETVVRDRYFERDDAEPTLTHLHVAVGVPIRDGTGVIGAFVAGRRAPLRTEEEILLVELLAEQAGRALATARAFEAQLAAMSMVERSARLKEDFVATVSHELRTPLQVVLGMAETLDGHWDSLEVGTRRRFAERLRRNAVDLAGLVDTVLDFSRLQSEHVSLRAEVVDVPALLADIVDRWQELAPGHEVTLHVDHEEDTTVEGDRALLDRVVENLVSNACRHTPAGSRVRVSARAVADDVVVEVRDDGPGIPPSTLARLGERFYRGEEDHLRRSARGVGIGLAFSMEVLALHGSELQIVSGSEGSCFAFRLPRSSAATVSSAGSAGRGERDRSGPGS